jgi:CubicO group peptidase (beta-lactamase class C family)
MSTESINFASSKVSTRAVVATFGVFVSALFWLVVATYPTFFFFNPLAESDGLRATILSVSTFGWVLLSTGPAVLFVIYALGNAKALMLLPLVALVWPASLLLNHVSLFIQKGNWYTGYLLDYPIFIATDILLPIMLMAVWAELRPAYLKHHSHSK